LNNPSEALQVLKKATSLLPNSNEELIYKGIAAGVSERLMALKKVRSRLETKHSSIKELEKKIKKYGITPDDHTLYTDLLEWRAINQELTELLHLFQTL
jgi:hypothetical protein